MTLVQFIRRASATLAVSFVWGAFASTDVGLVNQLQGGVQYQGSGAAGAKAAAFMNVREGDKFTLREGAVLRMVYFDGGRQETWKGPASFSAGVKQGDAQAGKAEVSQLPGGVSAKLSQTAEVIQIAKLGRAGGVTVRGVKLKPTPAQAAEVAQAKKTYDSWKATAAADDITPELYLYTVLQEYLLYDDMHAVVKALQDKQPNSPDVKEIAAWVRSRQN